MALLSALVAVLLAGPGTGEMAAFRALEDETFGVAARGTVCPTVDPACADVDLAPVRGLPLAFTTRGLEAGGPAAVSVSLPPLDALEVPITFNEPVREYLSFFRGRGRVIYARWLSRMGRYRVVIHDILRKHGLPPELIFVCMIESGFDPDAVSRAAAVGLWQFVRNTGELSGLRVDEWVDERRDPVKATEAAARHFAELKERFGTWPLALAAYNAGSGGVLAAISRTNSNDFWSLAAAGALPTEASRYVPKAMAAMIIGTAPRRFGFGDVAMEPPREFAEVLVGAGTDLRTVARAAQTSLAEISALNPELRRGFTPPDGVEYPLRVPIAAQADVASAVSRGGAKPPVFVEHRVRFGERLRDVAVRYGARRSELRRVNELPDGQPEPGRVLLVPRGAPQPGADEPEELFVVVEPNVLFDAGDRREVFFPIRYRIDVRDVAGFFRVNPGDVGLWNAIDPRAPLLRGMAVRLFVAPDFDLDSAVLLDGAAVTRVAPGTEAAENALAHAEKERPPTIKRVRHVIQRGDSLWRIAKRYNVTVDALRAENGIDRADALELGTSLAVPVRKTPAPRGKARRAPAKPDQRGKRSKRTYTVRRGDNLGAIAERLKVGLSALRKHNGLKSDALIHPGQVLRIP